MKYIFSFCFLFVSFVSLEAYSSDILSLAEAVEQGNAKDQYNLAKTLLEDGNYLEAAKWFKKAAEQAHLEAQFELGMMYSRGLGVPRDAVEALKWFIKAAEQGHVEAQSWFRKIFADETGLSKDILQSRKWIKLFSKKGDAEAQSLLRMILPDEIGVSKTVLKARKLIEGFAKTGDAYAQYKLAQILLEDGEGNFEEAIYWLKKSAQQNYRTAQLSLGIGYLTGGYLTGNKLPRNMTKAGQWFTVAFTQNDSKVQEKLKKLQDAENPCPNNFKK